MILKNSKTVGLLGFIETVYIANILQSWEYFKSVDNNILSGGVSKQESGLRFKL